MAWIHYQFETRGKPASALLDTQYAGGPPTDQISNLAWFGVYCRLPPGGGFWNPKEQAALDALESDLIRLFEAFGNGWASYVRRLDTPGLREYYVYFGGDAELEKVVPCLKSLHKGYRIESECRPDPQWTHYRAWLKESGVDS
jgi:Family of unknown function (DUF695)